MLGNTKAISPIITCSFLLSLVDTPFSTTTMNFKDLQFSLGKLTNEAYSHLARKNPLQKQDTKTLSQWIFEERNELYVMRMLAYHHSETNKAMEAWIREECSGEKAKENRDLEVSFCVFAITGTGYLMIYVNRILAISCLSCCVSKQRSKKHMQVTWTTTHFKYG